MRRKDASGARARASASAPARGLGLSLALLPVAFASSACGGGASADPGLAASFRIAGGQFVAGELMPSDPMNPPSGPSVRSVASANNRIYPGLPNRAVSGTVESTATGVAIGLAGDRGHFIIPSDIVDQTSPPDLTFSARGSFAKDLAPGPQTLLFRAVSRDGVMGPSYAQTLNLVATPISGSLVILLEWDTQADLDLHVVAPATGSLATAAAPEQVEIWTKHRNSLAKRAPIDPPFTAADLAASGNLDFDSNAQCAYDGRNDENVIWTQPPPAGHYVVRVDAFSLCGAATARWHAAAFSEGTSIADAYGQMIDVDTTRAHVTGAGVTAFEVDLPAGAP